MSQIESRKFVCMAGKYQYLVVDLKPDATSHWTLILDPKLTQQTHEVYSRHQEASHNGLVASLLRSLTSPWVGVSISRRARIVWWKRGGEEAHRLGARRNWSFVVAADFEIVELGLCGCVWAVISSRFKYCSFTVPCACMGRNSLARDPQAIQRLVRWHLPLPQA